MSPASPGNEAEIRIERSGPVSGAVHVPSSKSLTNRALALAALASGTTEIERPLIAADTIAMVRALGSLGVRFRGTGPAGDALLRAASGAPSAGGTAEGPEAPAGVARAGPHQLAGAGGGPGDRARDRVRGGADAAAGSLLVEGRSGRLGAARAPLDVGGAGTAMRFLTALASVAQGDVVLDGDARMRERPIGPLLDGLRALGAEAHSLDKDGFPPVRVRGGTLRGGGARIDAGLSSQFASALLMIGPLAPETTSIELIPPVSSAPYVGLTLDLMRRFGIEPRHHPPESRATHRYEFPGRGGYHSPGRYRVPPDASSASYFFAAAAATGGRVAVLGLRPDDLQGDVAILRHLEAMGCRVVESGEGTVVEGPPAGRLRPFDLDLAATPDLVPTLAVLALFADGPSEVRNVPSLRIKESDRIAALATELARLGAEVEERRDGLRIVPRPRSYRGARIETYRDHRIAMAFAVAGLVVPGVVIADPSCVEKSFPDFWAELSGLSGPGGPGRPGGPGGLTCA